MTNLKPQSLLEICAETLNLRSFTSAYHKTFELIECITDEEKGKALRLRHKIFCEEYGYECPTENRSYTESDQYDDRSVHFVLRHKVSNECAGTLRLTLPNDEAPGDSFPAQKHCDHPLLQLDSKVLRFCEISRFAMAPRFRQRRADGRFLSSFHDQDEHKAHVDGKITFVRRKIAYAPAALLQGAFEVAMQARILDCIWLVEPEHLESLSKIGFAYRALGPQVKYHGGAQPIIFNIKHVLDNMRRDVPACWEIISDGGRLQDMADDLQQDNWADRLLDDDVYTAICKKLQH